MSLSVLNSIFSSSLDRQRARYGSERVQASDEDENGPRTTPSPSEESIPTSNNNTQQDLESGTVPDSTATITAVTTRSSSDETLPRNRRSSSRSGTARSNSNGEESNQQSTSNQSAPNNGEVAQEGTPADENEDGDGDDEESNPDEFSATANNNSSNNLGYVSRSNTMTLTELEEQRELSRRRSSACMLLAVFVLFRLWIECLKERDPTLLLICLLGTSWTARWIRFNREREEELDRRIEAYLSNSNNNNGNSNGNTEVDRNEFARLSFQAQLALAIMESQRHMMEGGFGRPEGADEPAPGVSEEAKARWKQFQWNPPSAGVVSRKGDYGSVPTKGNVRDFDNHCSICLSEYEDSEMLTQLPCYHVYHDECIRSWTQNHVKCPLCNFDLEEGSSTVASDSTSRSGNDSVV